MKYLSKACIGVGVVLALIVSIILFVPYVVDWAIDGSYHVSDFKRSETCALLDGAVYYDTNLERLVVYEC